MRISPYGKYTTCLFGPLSLQECFYNYKLAEEKHRFERELADQNYGGWNFTHRTAADLKEHREALLRAFNTLF